MVNRGIWRQLWRRALLVVAPVLIVGAGAEAALRLLESRGQTGRESTAQPQVEYLACERDSTLGWVFPPLARGYFDSGSQPTAVSANSLGLRGPELDLDPAVRRIVVLGDSYAFGWGVAEAEAFPRRLERLARARYPGTRLEVVNAGIPGYGVLQQARMLQRILSVAPVHAVIANFSLANDPVDELRVARYLPDRLAEYEDGYYDEDSAFRRFISGSRLLTLCDQRLRSLRFHLDNRSGRALRLAVGSLDHLADVCAAAGVPCLLVVTPSASETLHSGILGTVLGADKARRLATDFAARRRLQLVDLEPALRAVQNREPLFLPNDRHWTPAGHEAVAETLMAVIPMPWWRGEAAVAPSPPPLASR